MPLLLKREEAVLIEEKAAKLFGIARTLDGLLDQDFASILKEQGEDQAPRQQQVACLHRHLISRCEVLAAAFPSVGLGYYALCMDGIVTYAPGSKFEHTIGITIPRDHIGRQAMAEGRESMGVGSMVRGDIMNCVHPLIRGGKVIGYSWANESVEDIFRQLESRAAYSEANIESLWGLTGFLVRSASLKVLLEKETEKAPLSGMLLEMERCLRLYLNTIPVAIAIADAGDNLIFGNSTMTETAGGVLPGTLATLLQDLGVADLYPQFSALEKQGLRYQTLEPRFLPSREFLAGIFLGLIENEHPGAFYRVFMVEDISRQREEENYRWRNSKLAATGEIAAALAHRIRNPLAIVRGAIDLIPRRLHDQKYLMEMSQVLAGELETINKTLEALLSFTRVEESRFSMQDINQILQEALQLTAPYAESHQIRVETSFDSLPLVMADPQQLKQAFLDLFVNAVQAMPQGGRLKVSTQHQPLSNLLEIKVEDTGIGIALEDREQVFDVFFTRKKKGTGLGLALVQRIVDRHQGFIDMESQVGKGTVFTITIPVQHFRSEESEGVATND